MLTTIEDLILYIYDPMNGFDRKALSARDRSILFSMGSQLKKPLALTEKQASLAVKILIENKNLYEKIETFNQLIESPLYKYPFRTIDSSRHIFVLNNTFIAIKFPFDNSINKLLEKVPGRKQYNVEHRCHCYKLNEDNIRNVMTHLKNKNFIIDTQIEEWYNDIVDIVETPTKYVPSVTITDNVELLNCNSYIEDYYNSNKKNDIIKDLFLAKTMRLFFDKTVQNKIQTLKISDLTKKYLVNNHHAISIEGTLKQDLCMMLQELDSYPILMLVDDNEIDFTAWVASFIQYGVKQSEMSVLFRSDKNTVFNEYIKNQQLNNLVDGNTKVVFIKNKMPKILYKLNFIPKIVISSSAFYVHYTSQKLVDSHPAVMYYTGKQYTGKKIAEL